MTYKMITKHISEPQVLERRACLCPGCPGTTSHHCLEWEGMPHAEVGLLTVLGDNKKHQNFLLFKRHTKQVPRFSSLSNPREGLISNPGQGLDGDALSLSFGTGGGCRGLGVEGHEVSQFRAGAVRGEASSGSGGRRALGAATLLLVWQFLFLLLQINVLKLLQNLIHEVLGILLVGHS